MTRFRAPFVSSGIRAGDRLASGSLAEVDADVVAMPVSAGGADQELGCRPGWRCELADADRSSLGGRADAATAEHASGRLDSDDTAVRVVGDEPYRHLRSCDIDEVDVVAQRHFHRLPVGQEHDDAGDVVAGDAAQRGELVRAAVKHRADADRAILEEVRADGAVASGAAAGVDQPVAEARGASAVSAGRKRQRDANWP